MSDIQEQIRNAASRNAEILAVLGKTDYAPPALEQQNKYIQELENAISRNDEKIRKLTAEREKELKDHRKYHDSVMKRFAYKATGKKEKFAAKADKEEQEYFQALRAEHQAKQEHDDLTKQLTEAKQAKSDLEPAAAEHGRAQKDLDELYNSIFAGPTPAFTEEDSQENNVGSALQEYRRIEGIIRAEEQAKQLLRNASAAMNEAQSSIESALKASTYDMLGGGTMADMMERSALGRAEGAVQQVLRYVDQARNCSPYVQALGPINIAQGNLMTDVFFDNFFTDRAFHKKIEESAGELHRAAGELQWNQQQTDQRLQSLQNDMSGATHNLENQRKQLQKVREQIFEQTVGKS